MQLSIIVPVYNMEADGKLAYCMDSLVNQTITDYEIIAVNDASTDGSLKILKGYEKQYPSKVKVIDLPQNHHQGGAKNFGLEICQGDFIGFVDSDDWLVLNCYERLLKEAEKTGADVVACDFCYVWEHTMEPTRRVECNRPEQVGVLDYEKKKALFMNPGASVTKIYRRELFFEEPFSFPDHMFFEDNATGIELLRRAKKFAYIPEPLYFYYQHSNSTVHVVNEQRCRDRMEAMRIMVRYAKENGYFDEFYPELEFKFINLFYQNTLFSYMQSKGRKNLAFLRGMAKEMKETFPDFSNNKYYLESVPQAERRFLQIHQKSTVLFLIDYTLRTTLWNLKKKNQ